MEQPLFTELLFFKLQGTDDDSVKEMRMRGLCNMGVIVYCRAYILRDPQM